jgi:hypothetical protein
MYMYTCEREDAQTTIEEKNQQQEGLNKERHIFTYKRNRASYKRKAKKNTQKAFWWCQISSEEEADKKDVR